MRGYFNVRAAYGLTIVDQAAFDNPPELRPSQISIFNPSAPSRGSRATTQFYDMLRAASETRAGARELAKRVEQDERLTIQRGDVVDLSRNMRLLRELADFLGPLDDDIAKYERK